MVPKLLIFGLIKSFHDLFTVLWIGGILTTAITFMPAFKKFGKKSPAGRELLVDYQHSLRIVFLVSFAGLWITGMLLSNRSSAYVGFMSFSTTYNALISIKHLIILVMLLNAVYRGFVLGRKIETFTPSQQKLYGGLLFLNALLGVLVLFLSGFSAALG